MLASGLQFFSDLPIPIFGLLLFFLTFAAVSTWTLFRSKSKEFYQNIAEIAIKESSHE